MIFKYFRPKDWGLVAICIILITIQVYLDLEIPGYMRNITVLISTNGTVDAVMSEGWLMIAAAFGSLIVSILAGLISAWIAVTIAMRLRAQQFYSISKFSMDEMNKFSTPSLITRSTNDITQIQMAMAMGLVVIVKAPILAVGAIMKIYVNSWQWTFLTAMAVVSMFIVIGVIMIYALPKFKKMQWLTDDVNRVTRENITGIRVVRAYNAESHQEAKFEKANDVLTKNNLSVFRSLSFLMPAMTAIMSLLSLSIYWMGAFLINDVGSDPAAMGIFADMIVFSSYAMQVVMAFMMLTMIFMILPRAIVAYRRVEEVIETEPSVKDGDVTGSSEGVQGEIIFKDVGFKYPNASSYVLQDINLKINKGETVAFIGSTGSGKSTLINLVPRFYDVTEGQVLVDGVDVRDYKQSVLHDKIGYVSQKAVLFSGTIASNVRYGDKGSGTTDDDVKKAVAIAQGTEFVEKMDKGYDAAVSQGGINLSGGQKQRISIARAINRKPEIFIFDDSFSALDYKTDRVLRGALKKETAGTTSLIVAQRIGTIMDADKIVVLDEGKVVGIGKHKELLENCSVYLEIAQSQMSDEELGR